jgi:8-hydroxy-5-deazaflavin:NADPH oxidoreductase
MKIAVIGAGNIGGTLSRKWAAAGHEVMVATRQAGSPRGQALQAELGSRCQLGSAATAADFGDIVVFAVPGGAMAETVKEVGSKLNGKPVIDATNNVGKPVMNSIDALSQAAPSARVFRAFNSLPWEVFANPNFGRTTADLFYCGPASDREAIEGLIKDVGLHPVYVGEARSAPVVDSLAGLYFALSQRLGRRLAFKLLAP